MKDPKTEKNFKNDKSMGVEVLFKELFNNMNKGAALFEAVNEGADFIIKNFNRSAELIGGLKRERVIGKKISETFPYVKKSGFLSVLQNVWKTGKAERHPNVLYQGEKSSFWVEGYVFKLSVGDIVVIFDDFTEQKRSEQMLKESEEKFRNLFEHSPIGIELYDSEGKLENANKACLDIFGILDSKDVKGFNLFNDPNVPEDYIVQIKKGKIVRYEREFDFEKVKQLNLYKTKKSGIIYIDVLITPLYSRVDNLISNYFVQIQDITQRKRAEELLQKSEARLRFLVSSSPAIIYMSKTSGDYGATYISQNVKMLTGYDSEEFTKDSKFWANHIHPDEKEQILTGLSNLYKKGHHLHEYRFRFKDGSYHWMIDNCNLVRDEKNNPIETIGYWIDITERKRIEDALKESEKKLKELNEKLEQIVEERTKELKESEKALRESQELLTKTLYSMKDAIFILNANTPPIIIDYNPITEKIFGYSRGELLGYTTAFLHVDETSLIRFQEYLYPKIKQFGFVQNYEFKMRRKDGSIFPTEHNVSELRNEKGEHIGWVSIVRDITERKETEEKLKESEEKYRNAYDREMLYKDILIHDFNNLLQNILSSVELSSLYLNDSTKLNNINELIDIIKEQVFRGKKMISNIRNLSQIEESKVPVKNSNLNRILSDSIEFIRQSFKNKAINIRVEPLKEEMLVYADDLLSEVFENLLINSIRYNDKPVAEVLVKISKHQENAKNYVKIEFIDNGIGITDEQKALIFQGGFVKKKRARGMGFGLSVVKKIIEHYNGKIWVVNKVKGDFTQGSNFILLIPEAI